MALGSIFSNTESASRTSGQETDRDLNRIFIFVSIRCARVVARRF